MVHQCAREEIRKMLGVGGTIKRQGLSVDVEDTLCTIVGEES